MKIRIFAIAAATIAAIAVLAVATPPLSVTSQSVEPAPVQHAALNDAEVKSFATAVVKVKRVADSYLPVLARTDTFQEQDRVEDVASEEIKQVVENEGLTVPRFNQILVLASVSPDLVDRIRTHLPQTQIQ